MTHKRLLIVDDEPHVRMTLKQMLEDADYGVATAESGPVALDYLDNNDCDLVLLDVRMPGRSRPWRRRSRRLRPPA